MTQAATGRPEDRIGRPYAGRVDVGLDSSVLEDVPYGLRDESFALQTELLILCQARALALVNVSIASAIA